MPNSLTSIDGVIHSIADAGSPVNSRISNVTESLQFKRWFGKSVVTDDSGKPMVMYHGTSASFGEFKKGDIGYHVGTIDQANDRNPKRIMPLYVKNENPLNALMDFGDWHEKNVAGMLIETEQLEEGYDDNTEEINARLQEIASMEDTEKTDEVLRNYLKKLGYDGIAYPTPPKGHQ